MISLFLKEIHTLSLLISQSISVAIFILLTRDIISFTDFKKASKNPIQKSKYFNLAEMFKSKTLPKTDEIASILDGKTWEEFH